MQELFHSYFTDIQLWLLICGIAFLVGGLVAVWKQKKGWALVSVVGMAACIFSFSALLDPFLNLWDERFHALVAKNLLSDPLQPMLYKDTVLDMSYDSWDRFHIWLHKQPLFLWQIALSFKVFGVSEFTLRLPSILMGVAVTAALFRVSTRLFSIRSAFIAALLFVSSSYIISLISGRQAVEHNDMAFLTYVSLSIWAFVEYYHTKKRYWLVLIGCFSGGAILCKWLVGLLVYFGWGVSRLLHKKYAIKQNVDILIAFATTVLVALPWQVYVFLRFPSEAAKALDYNSRHFSEVVEGHKGDMYYHFEQFDVLFGTIMAFLILPAFYVAYKKMHDKRLFWTLSSMVAAVYLFFTLAATKMPSFTLVVALVVYLFLGVFFDAILEAVQQKKLRIALFFIGIFALFFLRLDVEGLQEKHTTWRESNEYTAKLALNKEVFEALELPENAVLFNVPGRHYVDAMFYTDCTAYNVLPNESQLNALKRKGRAIVVLKGKNELLPDYITNDPTILIVAATIYRLG